MKPRDAINEIAAAAGTLAYNAVLNRLLPSASHIPGNLAAAGILTWYVHRTTRHWRELGLDHRHIGNGLRWGAAFAAPVAAGITVAAVIPVTQHFFAAGPHESLYEAIVRVPLGTAIPEEIIFRGALLGLFLEHHRTTMAVVMSSLLFGVWHVLPTLTHLNSNVAAVGAGGNPALTIALNVVFTGLAGVFFCWLRLRSKSLVTPVLVHMTTNSVAILAARLAG